MSARAQHPNAGLGRYEAIYGGMLRFGLGMAGEIVDATGAKQEARQRMKAPLAA